MSDDKIIEEYKQHFISSTRVPEAQFSSNSGFGWTFDISPNDPHSIHLTWTTGCRPDCPDAATGLREGEIVKLQIEDLYQTYGSVPALWVRSGKGAKARMVPFGDMLWVQEIIESYLMGRLDGPVFTAMIDRRGDMIRQRSTQAHANP